MKGFAQLARVLFLPLLPLTVLNAADSLPGRERISLNADWRFQKGDPAGVGDTLSYGKLRDWLLPSGNAFVAPEKAHARPEGNPGENVAYTQAGFGDGSWRKLNLPHDWAIEGPFDQALPGETGKLPFAGVGWYRKHFTVPSVDKGKRFYLDVDGAMSYAVVWCNGQLVGGWPYGYSSWRLDLTPFIKPGGDNVLAIRLDNPPESSRWYPGAGLYRNVWLVTTNPVHVAHWGTTVTTPQISASAGTVKLDVKVDNASDAPAPAQVHTQIFQLTSKDGATVRVPVAASTVTNVAIAPGKSGVAAQTISVRSPKLWSPAAPNLYVAVTRVAVNKQVVDAYETTFGFRTFTADPDKGFFLNGEPYKIRGVCMHHDLGALGAAFNVRAAERQLDILREMGVDAIRISHNPPAPEFLDLCDRKGFLIMDELVDCWKRGKKNNGYQRLFDDWSEKDLRAMVRRDRNHPSIVFWSTGNEILEQDAGEEGIALSKVMTGIVKSEDSTRLVTGAISSRGSPFTDYPKTFDVVGLNYKPDLYKRFRDHHPKLPLYGSETSSATTSRGEYFFPFTEDKNQGRSDFQVSSYDLYSPDWASLPEREFVAQDQVSGVGGEFVWTGFDYLGEPTPFSSDVTNLLNYHTPEAKAAAEKQLREMGKISVPSRSSYFGIVDLAGFPKDRFYLYQARWRPDLPMAHILPHWNWPERVGEVTPVHVYTSGDEAELFLNGKSLGRKKKKEFEYRLRWDDVKYQPGELKVQAYKDGRPWAQKIVRTTGPAAQLLLAADRAPIRADGLDLAYVTATVADKSGALVPRSKIPLEFSISGPGEIVATDNGDPTDQTAFASPKRKAFNGLALAIVRAKPGPGGPIVLRVTAAGLPPAEITLRSAPAR